jgi:hypothetical protein
MAMDKDDGETVDEVELCAALVARFATPFHVFPMLLLL